MEWEDMCMEHREEDVVVVWKKSAKACFQIGALPRSLQLMRKSLELDIVHISAGEEEKKLWMFDTRQTLKLTIASREKRERVLSTFNNIYLLQVYSVGLRVKPAGHLWAATVCPFEKFCGSLNDIVKYIKCEEFIEFNHLSICKLSLT